MSEFTPTTEQVREAYARAPFGIAVRDFDIGQSVQSRGEGFDRMLAEYRKQVEEEVAQAIERRYLGPDSGRLFDGREAPDAPLRRAYDEGLEVAARTARGVGGAS